ncbi:MAG TPA: hypothetical protein VIY51_15275 [Xanthobacteraceae bacterium]
MTKLPILIGSEKLRRPSGLPAGGTVRVPGCLTSESEERETWTAESLRAASSNGAGFLALQDFLLREEDAAGRDFGGRRFRSTLYCRESGKCRASGGREREQSRARLSAHVQEWDLVNGNVIGSHPSLDRI